MGYHGKPDWGLQVKKTVYSMDDLSELAVRLGSISQFDRRGDIVFMDSFENGLNKWLTFQSGTDAGIKLSTYVTTSGGYSVKLIGGKTSAYYASITNYLPYPSLSKYGFEVHFSLPVAIDKIYFEFYKYTKTQGFEGIISYDDTNNKLQYEDSTGVFQDIETSFTLVKSNVLFHVIKLVIDLENNKYHRLIVNETTYDLSAYDIRAIDPGLGKNIATSITLYSNSGDNDYAYIDNIIVTQNEP